MKSVHCQHVHANLFAGTSLICAFLEIFLSFIPPRILKRIFPPMVTGTFEYPSTLRSPKLTELQGL